MKWFTGCKNADEVRARYRDLARKHHPDMGGDVRTMQDINAEYTVACRMFARASKPNQSTAYYEEVESVDERLRKTILELLKLRDIIVEICGTWIWVTGDTYSVKGQLKALGLKYSSKKMAWYWVGAASNGHGRYTLDQIRVFHGSRVVNREGEFA